MKEKYEAFEEMKDIPIRLLVVQRERSVNPSKPQG
ncbi:hypothetical protein PIIN_10092 [Serendipita indica DSM 11827]|uniref:Uncharacterized protein n=1 Tax=Serendipita indica (strain DSM 11827) TaxID=1109443 RepID=G4TXP9_SERID|nr:hypothetical protein PIIN_10092 [Serendipita indica DSM 11827]